MGAWERAMYPHIYIWIFDEAITTFILAIVAVHVLKLRNPKNNAIVHLLGSRRILLRESSRRLVKV